MYKSEIKAGVHMLQVLNSIGSDLGLHLKEFNEIN